MLTNKKINRRILGVDPGYDRCGVAILEGMASSPKIIFSCCIETSRKKTLPERLRFVFNCLSQIIKEYQPTDMAIEDIFFTTNQKTAVKVSEAKGICLLAGSLADLKISEYTPLQVKTYLVGYGKADKKQIQTIVKKIFMNRFGRENKGSLGGAAALRPKKLLDDEIDAIAIALTHLFVQKH